jgi:hypothetical protein
MNTSQVHFVVSEVSKEAPISIGADFFAYIVENMEVNVEDL